MKKTRRIKILSLVISLLMLFVSMPTYIFAFENETKAEAIDGEQTEAPLVADNDVYVVEEDVSLREENVKHFKLSDGTVKAVSYAQAVHYLDSDGSWIDIDNTLSLNGSEHTAKNKQEIKFANKSDSNGLLSIKDGEYKIDFTPLNTNKVNVEIENPQENNSRKFDDVKKLNNVVSKAIYKSIYDGIDIEYILVGNNIKENIIVNEKQDTYSFSFEIELSKLKAELSGNEIILSDYDSDEVVYVIPAPYMLDASGEYSDSVEYSLTQNSKWKYTFTVTAAPEWINDEARQFPVTIDPTVIMNNNITDINATFEYIKSNGEITDTIVDITDNGALIVGNFVNYLYDSIAFMKFNTLPELPAGVEVTDANLSLYSYNFFNDTNISGLNIGVFPAMADWTTLTDVSISGNYSMFNDYCNANDVIGSVTVTGNGDYNCNITELYNRWLSGTYNNGFCLKGMNLPADDNNSATDEDIAAYIVASNGIAGYASPNLEVSYTYLIGVEDYYAYAENTLGDVGKSYVNLYNGSLTYINKLTSIEIGENLTYDINMVYNSIDKTWTPSFNECIMPYDGEEDVYGNKYGIERYIWKDQDGTYHAFKPIVEINDDGEYETYQHQAIGENLLVADPTVFYPEDDIDYVLVQTTNNEFILRDYDGNQKMFDSDGRLSKICDEQGNLIHFSYLNGKLSVIDYKAEDNELVAKANFLYENSNLIFVYNYTTKLEISLVWDDDYLSQISYNDIDNTKDNTVNVDYVESFNGIMIDRISDALRSKYLKYSTLDDEKISTIKLYNSNDNLILQNSIVYNFQSTTCNNSQTGSSIEYTFDGKGRDASITHNDSLVPDSSYYDIVYSQHIYNQGGNLVKYDMITGGKDYFNVVEQEVNFDSELTNISTTNSFPTEGDSRNKVCKIIAYFSDGTSKHSTGFLVGPNTLVTAAHSILDGTTIDGSFKFNFPTSVTVIPACNKNGEYDPFGQFEITTCYVQKEYYYLRGADLPERHQYDWAVCSLNENIENQLDWFELIVPDERILEQYALVYGYVERTVALRKTKGEIIQIQGEEVIHSADVINGMSGGPAFLNNTDYIVFGIFVAGQGDNAKTKRIDPLIYTLVNNLN